MNLTKINQTPVENSSVTSVGFRNNNNIEPQTNNETEKNTNSNLSSQQELVGRSMVNFKGAKKLNSSDLNYIADTLSGVEYSSNELKVLKQAFLDTMKQYKVPNLTKLISDSKKDLDSALDLYMDIFNNIKKIDSNADIERYAKLVQKF